VEPVEGDGTFRTAGLVPGKYTLMPVSLPLKVKPVEVTLKSVRKPLRVELPAQRPAGLKVSVSVPAGRALRELEVSAKGPGLGGEKQLLYLVRKDPLQGRFSLGDLWPGRYQLETRLPGHRPFKKTLWLKEGESEELECSFAR
jgi:hypothetical protein